MLYIGLLCMHHKYCSCKYAYSNVYATFINEILLHVGLVEYDTYFRGVASPLMH